MIDFGDMGHELGFDAPRALHDLDQIVEQLPVRKGMKLLVVFHHFYIARAFFHALDGVWRTMGTQETIEGDSSGLPVSYGALRRMDGIVVSLWALARPAEAKLSRKNEAGVGLFLRRQGCGSF
jgi:hypothetical protein